MDRRVRAQLLAVREQACPLLAEPLNGQARYRFVLDGLYLAGSGAHPGGGITGGPGANAARQILKDLKA